MANTPFPTILPAGQNGPSSDEFRRLQANIANAIKNLGPSSNVSSSIPVVASYYLSATQAPGAGNPINFDTVLIDTGGSNPLVTTGIGTWKFTAKMSGYYSVSVVMIYNSGEASDILVYKNNVSFHYIGSVSAILAIQSCGAVLSLVAGDFIDVRLDGSTTIDGSPLPYRAYINVVQVH